MTPDDNKYSKNESDFHAKLTVWTLLVETESCKDQAPVATWEDKIILFSHVS